MVPPTERDERLDRLVDLVVALASGRLDTRLTPSPASDAVDAVIVGLNMLGEELSALYTDLEARIAERTAQLEDTRRQLEHLALHDPLTGLANRALFADRLQHAFAGYQRNGWPLTLLFIDLDDFKSVNDEHGHAVGDELLVLVARRLAECSRAVDTVARMGGDEFAVLCEHTALDDGLRIAERLADAACRPATIDGHRVAVTASVGVQSACPEVDDPDTLLRRADSAMYENKRLSKLQRSA